MTKAAPTSAARFLETRLEPDPNHPDKDTFVLHFPHGEELVEGREFWANNLAELLEAYATETNRELLEALERALAVMEEFEPRGFTHTKIAMREVIAKARKP